MPPPRKWKTLDCRGGERLEALPAGQATEQQPWRLAISSARHNNVAIRRRHCYVSLIKAPRLLGSEHETLRHDLAYACYFCSWVHPFAVVCTASRREGAQALISTSCWAPLMWQVSSPAVGSNRVFYRDSRLPLCRRAIRQHSLPLRRQACNCWCRPLQTARLKFMQSLSQLTTSPVPSRAGVF